MKLQRKRRLMSMVPTASMGDIAFLLIIFFMVTSDFMKTGMKAEPPRSPDIETMRKAAVIVVVDNEGTLWLEGQAIDVASLEGKVKDLLEGRKDRTVMLKIDKGQQHRTYGPVFMALSNAEADIALIGQKAN